ncbi:MAG: XdhC family protein, partial [Desulfovibrionaceae bacterium]
SAGAKMAVRPVGCFFGTVGGGLVVAQAILRAAALHARGPGAAERLDMNLTSDLAAGTDMICGGRVTLVLEAVGPADAPLWAGLDDSLRRGETAVLLTRLPPDAARVAGRSRLPGQGPTENAGLRDAALAEGGPLLRPDGDGLVLVEPFAPRPPVYLFGAGHVSQATARVAALTGFRVIVLDDRAEFANVERFPEADQVLVLDDLHHALPEPLESAVPEDCCLVIVTRGHVHDKTVLAQALRTRARYVGMIGSRTKRDQVYAALRAEGFTEADIARCHCPIGLPIGAQTPEEIALSIVAELVAVRAGKAS